LIKLSFFEIECFFAVSVHFKKEKFFEQEKEKSLSSYCMPDACFGYLPT